MVFVILYIILILDSLSLSDKNVVFIGTSYPSFYLCAIQIFS